MKNSYLFGTEAIVDEVPDLSSSKATLSLFFQQRELLIAGTLGIIHCSSEGTPSPQIRWSKQGGMEVDLGRFIQLSNGSLHINPVHEGDNGTYICVMQQNKGADRVTSDHKIISVSIISEYGIAVIETRL